MRLAVDATALLLPRTGIGVFTAEVLRALAARPDIHVSAFNAIWRGRGRGWLPSDVADEVHEVPGRIPTGGVRWLWDFLSVPRLEWFAGKADVVHGPNYAGKDLRVATNTLLLGFAASSLWPSACWPTCS